MSQEQTEAIVLRGVDFSETSRIVTLLTPDRGRLVCMAKGARRARNTTGAALCTFNRLEIVYYWKDSRSVQQLGDVTLVDSYEAVKGDLDKATYAAFPLELALRIAHENEPSHELFDAVIRGLENLNEWNGDARTHACWQATRILSAAGFEPAMDMCVLCGAPLSDVHRFSFEGGTTCADCPSDRKITRREYDWLVALITGTTKCPETKVDKSIFDLVQRYAARQLDSDFRSVRVIQEMFD